MNNSAKGRTLSLAQSRQILAAQCSPSQAARLEDLLDKLSPEACTAFQESALLLHQRLGLGFATWVERGLREIDPRSSAAVAFFDLSSARGQELLAELESAARLQRHRPALQLYAEAMLGCSVTLEEHRSAGKPADDSTVPLPAARAQSSGFPRFSQGGIVLRLPSEISTFEAQADNRTLLRATLLHQIGLHLAGTFAFTWRSDDPRFAACSGFDPRSSMRPGRPAGGGFAEFYAAFTEPPLARLAFGFLEHRRVDAFLVRRFPGYRRDLERLRPALLPRSQSLLGLLQGLSLGHTALPVHGNESRSISHERHALQELFAEVAQPGATVATAAAVAIRLWQLLAEADLLALLSAQSSAETASSANLPVDTDPLASAASDAPDPATQAEGTEGVDPPSPADRFDLHREIGEEFAQAEQEHAAHLQVLRQLEAELDERGLELPDNLTQELVDPNRLGVLSIQDGDLSAASGLFLHDLDFLDQCRAGDIATDLAEFSDETLQEAARELADRASRNATKRGKHGIVDDAYHYDEWDHQIADYRPAWCRLVERIPAASSPVSGGQLEDEDDFVRRTLRRHHDLLGEIRRQFELLKPEMDRKLRRLLDGEELDFDRLIEDAVDRRCGLSPSEQVYTRRNRQERSVATAFLLDMSASTDTEVPDSMAAEHAQGSAASQPHRSRPPMPDPRAPLLGREARYFTVDARFADEEIDPTEQGIDPQLDAFWTWPPASPARAKRRRVIDVEKEAIVLMAEALRVLGDQYAVYGFSGFGRLANDFYIAKEFSQPYDQAAERRIAALQPRQSTRMGPAIRHAVSKLEAAEAKVKALLVLSDGYPQDSDYGPERGDRTYGMQDTMVALREAEQRGIHTFCITVDPAGHDYLREMCPERRYLVIDDVAALPRELPKVYRGMTS